MIMVTPSLDTIYDYLALLISERGPKEPFLLSQFQAAIIYKFPDFAPTAFGLSGMKEFILTGEKAGYFKLVNTGDSKTAHFVPGSRQPKAMQAQTAPDIQRLSADDPRRMQWMNELVENLLNCDRADQILDAMRGTQALSPAFDEYLATRIRTEELYPVRGKLVRLREFFKVFRERGETLAVTSWQPSRAVLRMPSVPPIRDASQAGGIITALMQGNAKLAQVPVERLTNLFVAVLRFYKYQLGRDRSLDWVVGLDLLEVDVRAVPRPEPPPTKGLNPRQKQQGSTLEALDDSLIEELARNLLKEAGIRASYDETAIWRAFAGAPSMDVALQFLRDRPTLLKSDPFMTWMEDEISRAVEAGDQNAVRALANKSALLIGARQMGIEEARQHSDELKKIVDSVLQGAQQMNLVFAFLKAPTPQEAHRLLSQRADMLKDDTFAVLMEDQMMRAAKAADVQRYRRASERADLLNKVIDLGLEHGMEQHLRQMARPRDDRTLLTEMGLLLMPMADSLEEKRDVLERFPTVASKEGLAMVNASLDVLSFRGNQAEFRQHLEIKRLIERCLEVGIDRALVEMK